MTPDVTAIIPVWDDHVQLLPRCLAALGREPLSVATVIVDNASRIRIDAPPDAQLVTLSNRQSVGAARNAGLAHVTTPYVVFADADDEIAPGSLTRGLNLLQRAPRSPGVIGRSIVDEHGSLRRGRTPRWPLRLSSRLAPPLTPLLWLAGFQGSITTTLLRTSAVRDAGGFLDDDMGEDWTLAARLARRSPFICVSTPVRLYHRHAAATRIRRGRDALTDEMRRTVCAESIADPRATVPQRLLARALLRSSDSAVPETGAPADDRGKTATHT